MKRLVFAGLLLAMYVSRASASTLLSFDFNSTASSAWPTASATASPKNLTARAAPAPVGTIDTVNSTDRTGGMQLVEEPSVTGKAARSAALLSGLLEVRNSETNLSKLTFSFDLSVSVARPVKVRVESFDTAKQRTGGLVGTIYPAAADFYQRYALDLSTLAPAGAGKFQPTAPYVQFSWAMDAADGWPSDTQNKLLIDNAAYASPAFYVSPQGSDANDGRTEATPFLTPQKAVDAAKPGDIVLLMDGLYQRPPQSSTQEGTIYFRHGGTPAAWVVVKNYPGQHPILTSDSWNTIKIGLGSQQSPSGDPALAYIELRGLHIRGNALVAKEKFADAIGKPDPSTNGNGISVDSRFETNIAHHIRIADNIVENCCGGGISALQADWITTENNVVRDNCWWMIYAGSGISFLTTSNFDTADGIYKDLIRNNTVSGNRCFEKWSAIGKMSDGNGIIIDTNFEPEHNRSHRGRTLIQSNLSFNNGGSGIHAFRSHRVDIVNNTAYCNGATPELNWGQIFVQRTDDARILNNILVSRPGQPVNSIGPDGGDQGSTNVVRAHNIYFGGLTPKLMGDGDLLIDPMFVKPSTDALVADFHVLRGSPAIKAGAPGPLAPLLELDNKLRGSRPTIGAYEN